MLFPFALAISLFCYCLSDRDMEGALFRLYPLNNDLKPIKSPVSEKLVSSKSACACSCFGKLDSSCVGFLFNKETKICSVYNSSLYFMTFAQLLGTRSYVAVPVITWFDCYDVFMDGHKTDGVYTILSRDNSSLSVFCELSSHDPGWLVIQRRRDGSEDFDRTWNEYRDGFGTLTNEFWLGNAIVHTLTTHSQHLYELRIDLEDFEGDSAYAVYDDFSLDSEQDYFKLNVGRYSGTAGNSLSIHNGMNFSAKDRDLDKHRKNCAQLKKCGWWFKSCQLCNLNGEYFHVNDTRIKSRGIVWYYWHTKYYSVKASAMKIRRKVKVIP